MGLLWWLKISPELNLKETNITIGLKTFILRIIDFFLSFQIWHDIYPKY